MEGVLARKMNLLAVTVPITAVLFLVVPASAQQPILQFEKDILPILTANCAKCHAGSTPQAGLDVRTRAALVKGGKSGAVISPGSSATSLLYQRIESGQMPPGGPPLAKADLARIGLWIEQGAPALMPEQTRIAEPGTSATDRAHWAFQSPVRPIVPKVKNPARVRTPVDSFVLAELEKRNLTLSADADRITLLRRVTFDITGLPPTPASVDEFLADQSPNAYEKVVDRLLASPQYGERWARQWLDVAGYADSEGVLAADVIRPNAWRYRDYVIRAFNSDKPYKRFLIEQLAGDELSEYWNYDKLPPEKVELLEATGFLRTAVDGTRPDFNQEMFAEYQWRTMFSTEQIVASSLLGMTMHCARCHDHKYEPIAQKDYYRFEAFFVGAIRPDGPVLASAQRAITLATAEEKKHAEKVNPPFDGVVKAVQQLQQARMTLYRSRHPKGDEATDADLREMFPGYATKADELKAERRAAEAGRIDLPTVRALYDIDSAAPPTHVFARGATANPAEEVAPAVPNVLNAPQLSLSLPPAAPGAKTSGRRLALANWLTSPDHPLTARVMVNRLWAGHFGTGIVATTDNFGKSGAPPVNQPLLDWLATEFVRQGWSVKTIHRLIVTSTTYRQASSARVEGLAADPDDKLLWRLPPRRLEGEMIRDAVLEAAGTLDSKMYGEAVGTEEKKSGEIVPIDETKGGRRSIYQIVRRSAPQSFLNAFDAPVMEINCTRRVTSTSATQTLALMNGQFIRAQSEHFAKRVLREAATGSDRDAVTRAFRIALSREPTPSELDLQLSFLSAQRNRYPDVKPADLTLRIYADLCQALLSANEFVYID
jgi:hypothetical protein